MLTSVCVCSVMSDSLVIPRTVANQAPLLWNFPGKKTGVGCHFLLQGIFLTQGSNPSLLHRQSDSLPQTIREVLISNEIPANYYLLNL